MKLKDLSVVQLNDFILENTNDINFGNLFSQQNINGAGIKYQSWYESCEIFCERMNEEYKLDLKFKSERVKEIYELFKSYVLDDKDIKDNSKISLSVSPSPLPTKDSNPPLETIDLNNIDASENYVQKRDRKANIFNYSQDDYDDDYDYNNYKHAPNIKLETSDERSRKFAKKSDNSRSSSTNKGDGNNYSSGLGSAFHRQPSSISSSSNISRDHDLSSRSSTKPPPPPQRKIEGTYLHIYNHLL